jgi:hypothetical protein
MPLIQSSVSVPLSSVNDNVLSGSQFEFLPYNALLEFGINGDANGADLRIDIYSGQDIVTEQLTPSVQNRIPVYPDDYIGNDVAAAGERIKIRVRNTSAAAARTVFFAVRITPV